MAKCILIKGGGGISSEDVTVTKADIPVGVLAITSDSNDEVVEGTFTLENELNEQDDLISRISAALEGKGVGSVSLQSKTVSPSTSQQTITADSGYDGLSEVIIGAMDTATQATPSISVSSSGLITASSTQSAGYVSSGTKNATKQLSVQAAKTVTPNTTNQTVIASGVYTTGAITVKGDANLKKENIVNGVSIFGVTGNYVGSGSGSGLDESYCIFAYNGSNLVRQVYSPDGRFDHAFYLFSNKVTNMIVGNNVISMFYTYRSCSGLTGSPVCGDKVTSMFGTYNGCSNLTGSPVCGDNVTNMYSTYDGCYNLTGSPVCGDKVTNMYSTYDGCSKLTGSPVCGNNVTNMSNTYSSCSKLTGSPVCGNNVTNMSMAYYGCRNLTGSPVCGDKVTNMYMAYNGCRNLTGDFVCGNKVTDVSYCFNKATNIQGNHYYNYSPITCAIGVYTNRNTSKRLNIYINGTYFNKFNITNTYSIVGKSITWATNSSNGCSYNTTYNIYLYNIAAIPNNSSSTGGSND